MKTTRPQSWLAIKRGGGLIPLKTVREDAPHVTVTRSYQPTLELVFQNPKGDG